MVMDDRNLILIVLGLMTIVSTTVTLEINSWFEAKDCKKIGCESKLHSYSNIPMLSLHLLPGLHHVSKQISITNVTNVEITGKETAIAFNKSGALIFRNITRLTFKDLNLTEEVVVNITMVDSVVLEKCNINAKGSMIALYIANVQDASIINCQHRSTHGGLLSVKNAFNLSVIESSFIGNKTMSSVKTIAIALQDIHNVVFEKCYILNNSVTYTTKSERNGGAITLMNIHEVQILNSIFESNLAIGISTVVSKGGAIYSEHSQLKLFHCDFKGNKANYGGSVYSIQGSLYSSLNTFENNHANSAGGAIYTQGDISTSKDRYITNGANYGGALWILAKNATSFNNYFEGNKAYYCGGAIYFSLIANGLFETFQNTFSKNNALRESGGSLFMLLTTDRNLPHHSTDIGGFYRGDRLQKGAGIFSSEEDIFAFSIADNGNGGAIFAETITLHIKLSRFLSNSAQSQGATIAHSKSSLEAIDCEFSHNNAADNSVLYTISASFKCINCTFLSNNGSLKAVNSIVEIGGTTLFANNSGITGGAITSLQSQIFFTYGRVTIAGNKAVNGGGISLFESQLNVSSFACILENVATNAGGGIYAYRSNIFFHPTERIRPISMELVQNNAFSGGGSYLIASTIKLFQDIPNLNKRSNLVYANNVANYTGGALYLDHTSKIYFYKVLSGRETTTELFFYQNLANYGGAVYISDETASTELCDASNEEKSNIYEADCFIQILKLGNANTDLRNELNHHRTTYFIQNIAREQGNALYGGLFDRCSLNPNAETPPLTTTTPYCKATYIMNFNYDTFYCEIPSDHIASDAVQVCFCTDTQSNEYNCTQKKLNVPVTRGETFKIGITAIDHVQNQLAATIVATFTSNGGTGTLKGDQTRQIIDSVCTDITFNVYTVESEVQLDIFAEGPCNNKGISKRTLEVISQQCECPIGFQPADTNMKCECICDSRLDGHIYNCSVADQSVLLSRNTWIGYVHNTQNNTGFVIQSCPLDYCHEKPINISFTSPEGVDLQCAFNRSDLLCGQCKQGYSQVIGSSRCMECTNKFLSLLILFGFFGILLVAFILILNMTVAAGTIHGLIFYANTVGTTQSVFFSSYEATHLKVFISWLNLDFGIETCFYDGMDAYAKVLLQLIFPIYLILLTTTIIILCEHSQRFTKLLGTRNPVATLCTLILLSYSKLLNIIIAALQFAVLHYPDGTYQLVWLYDANVPYFATSHIPRFIAASLVLMLGTIYTLLLFFGQWLPSLSHWKIAKWISHPKYNAFIDAYHAPFSEKHRYWVGLLLFARILHTLIVALIPNDFVALLSIACVSLFIIVLKSVNKGTYKNRKIDYFENFVFVNLTILPLGTFYIRESNSNEVPLITISTTIIVLQFLLLLGYHIFKYLLDGSKIWTKLKQVVVSVRRPTLRNALAQHPLQPILQDSSEDEDTFRNEMDHCLGTLPTMTSTTTDSSRHQSFPEPIIQSAVISSQLRFPDLDIIDPVTPGHYKSIKPKQITPPTVKTVTTTFVNRPTP